MEADRQDIHQLSEDEQQRLAHIVMRRQAKLSIQVAMLFLVLLFGLPLVNFYAPELAQTPILGIPASWLFLGVLFYPITWLLSFYFVHHSDGIEGECANWRGLLDAEQDALAQAVVVEATAEKGAKP